MEVERTTLRLLEKRHYELEQQLESCTRPTEEETLSNAIHKQQELIDNQRRLFDDLEFQQLEVELSSHNVLRVFVSFGGRGAAGSCGSRILVIRGIVRLLI